MASLNKILLIGNLGRDSELTYTPNGKAKLSFSMATNENRRNGEGEWTQETDWHRIILWGEPAVRKAETLKRGRPVFVEGKSRTRRYTAKDGVERSITEVTAWRVQLLAGGLAAEPSKEQAAEDMETPF